MDKAAQKGQPFFNLPTRPLLIVISGPSGVGKDAIVSRMKKSDYPVKYVITLSTRSQRASEKNNIDYHFVSNEEFQQMIENKELLEWANVYGNLYGVPKKEVTSALEQGQDVLVKVDIQGAASIKKIVPEAITIFVIPPSFEELEKRLKKRSSESTFDRSLRLKTAEEEMKQLTKFDYAVVNRLDKIDLAVEEIKAIIAAEKCRIIPG